MRQTKMLKFEEVKEDLGISSTALNELIELRILKPIFLGKGWKFSQQDILEFQRDYRGLKLSNFGEKEDAYVKVNKRKATAATVTNY